MPIQLIEEAGGKVLAVHVTGKLGKADYEHFVPEFERLVQQHGKLRVLFDMTGFHGWTAGALWEDTKFALHHCSDIERIAVVVRRNGRKAWQPFASRSQRRRSDTSTALLPQKPGSGWTRRNRRDSLA